MITLENAARALEAKTVFASTDFASCNVGYVVACDLMSDVLVVDVDDILLVTSLVSRQSLKTAHLVGAVAICFVNNKTIPDELLSLATELDLSVIQTPLDKFTACVALGKALQL